MKQILSFMPAFLFTILASASAHAGSYDKGYFLGDYWSGEWPPGFSVAKKNVRVFGRLEMDKKVAKDVSCLLPYKAVFNQWNSERSEKSEVRYRTASKIVKMIANEDFELSNNEDGSKIQVKKGQALEYLMYIGEGNFYLKVDNEKVVADWSLFDKNVTKPDDSAFREDQWIYLRCEEGEYAWLMLNDLQKVRGLWSASIGDPGVVDYGTARDLTDEEVAHGRKH